MIEPSPYRSIAVASTFSPRFDPVLSEAKRIRDRFGSQLSLIYVGEKTDEVCGKFNAALDRLSLPSDSTIYFEQGNPADAILRAIDSHTVELVMAGALNKEVILHPFLGNVARRLLRESRSSVLLFTAPALEPAAFAKIVFVTDYSEHSIHALWRTLHLARAEKTDCLYVVRIITTFDLARAGKEAAGAGDEEAALEKFVLDLGATDVPMEVRVIRGNTGFAAADFVKSIDANLLVVPVDPNKNGGQLPPHLEWLTDVIPCNLWVIR